MVNTKSIPTILLTASLFGGDEGTSKFRVNVDMVQLRAAVTDSAGHYIRDLTLRDFRVFENGAEQKVRFVATPANPEAAATTVFVLFDTSNRMYGSFVYAEDAIANFIRQLAPADPVAVYSFSRNVTRLARATLDRITALIGLRHAVSGDETALYDAILVTVRDAAKVSGNKVVVVFSDGPDTSSILAPEQVRSVAEDEGVPIYVVSTRQHNELLTAAFQELTQNTGGKTYFATQWQQQRLAFEAIDEDLKNSYVISYYPQGGDSTAFRKIEVQIVGDDGHAYRIRTRSGYRPVQLSEPTQ